MEVAMDNTSSHVRVSSFRHQVFVWMSLFFLLCSFFPTVSMAQQPTATIDSLNGTVLVNNQKQDTGTVLRAGDVIETQAGASVVLRLADGSSLELGENSQVNLAELSQTATQARVSRIKLMWGWMRAKLSPDHQHEGSSFDIETPNAVIGVKFSQPDIEVSYNAAEQETIGIAHTVALIAKNLLTDEEMLVSVGSTVVISGATITIIAGIVGAIGSSGSGSSGTVSSGTGTSGSSSSGMGTGTKVVIGTGVVAAAGGIAALAVSSGSGDDSGEGGSSVSFTGAFRYDMHMSGSGGLGPSGNKLAIFTLVQDGASVAGTYEVFDYWPACSTTQQTSFTLALTGTIDGETLHWNWPLREETCRYDWTYSRVEGGSYTANFLNDSDTLYIGSPPCGRNSGCWPWGPYIRQ